MRIQAGFLYLLINLISSASFADDPVISSNLTNSKNCSPLVKPVYYIVEKGDRLSDIIRTFGLKPIYGNKTQIHKNSRLFEINNPDLIFPNQEILLPFPCEEDALQFVLIDKIKSRQIDRDHLVKKEAILKSQNLVSSSSLDQNIQNFKNKVSIVESHSLASQDNSHAIESYFLKKNYLSADMLYSFYRIDADDSEDNARASLFSKPSYGLRLGWEHQRNQRLAFELEFLTRSIEMRKASVGTLTNEKQITRVVESTAAATGAVSPRLIEIFGSSAIGGSSWLAPISELMIFTSTISSTERQNIERDQGAFYSITVP